MISFDGKVALVVGGASGIGRATAKLLASLGAEIFVADRNEAGMQKTLSDCGKKGEAALLDVTRPADWQKLERSFVNRSLDVMVNCAGIGRIGDLESITPDDWDDQISVNVTGTLLAMRFAVPLMRKGGSGAIVNIASAFGFVGAADSPAYCATKAAVISLTKSAALHCAARCPNVRVNAVAPTYVNTEMLEPIAQLAGGRETLLATLGKNVPVGRVAQPEEVANVIAFLASSHASMVTGETVLVDGAQMAGSIAAIPEQSG